jgi:hypothetical protein
MDKNTKVYCNEVFHTLSKGFWTCGWTGTIADLGNYEECPKCNASWWIYKIKTGVNFQREWWVQPYRKGKICQEKSSLYI